MADALLSGLGPLQHLRNLGFRVQGYPETARRAQEALAADPWPIDMPPVNAVRRRFLEMTYNAARHEFSLHPVRVAVTWGGLRSGRSVFMMGASDAGARCLYLERGPLAGTITIDPVGVNDHNCLPREAGFYLYWLANHPEQSEVWRAFAARVRQREATVERPGDPVKSVEGPFIFVPLQKNSDTQLQIFGERCRSLSDTLAVVAGACGSLPAGWHIRLKEHPSEKGSITGLLRKYPGLPIVLDNASDTFDLVRASALVLTVNSSVGLEAMLFEKPVVAMGRAYWAIEGIAARAAGKEELAAVLAAPEAVGFDAAARNAFLSFLAADYYPALTGRPDGSFVAGDDNDSRIGRRLRPGYPSVAG